MTGLTDTEVKKNRLKYGSNKIEVKNENKFVRIFLESLGDPIIKIMLIALVIKVVFLFSKFDFFETLGMLISILLSSLISSLSEYGSNKAFKRLQSEYESINVKVKRNNKIEVINIDDIVVDDIVYLESGELVPADGYIISGRLDLNESTINGESSIISKNINDSIFKGSIVDGGSAIIKVTKVGINTIMGSIALELNEKTPDSPMKIRLTKLAKIISKIGIIGAICVAISYLFNVIFIENDFDMNIIMSLLKDPYYILDNLIYALTLSVTIIIVCVPEGLPMMVALVLSSNMKRMVKNNVLVRKPVGIETSGSLNVLLTDKTGTLTKGHLEVIGLIDADNYKYSNISEINNELVLESLIYNNSSMFVDKEIIGGNQTDKAILQFIGNHQKKLEVINSIPFSSDIKYSSVTLSNNHTYFKGASEVIIKRCTFYLDKNNNKKIIRNKDKLYDLVESYTKRAMRVIAISNENTLLGFILMKDEIREDAVSVLKELNDSGIKIIMITGDDLNTASVIANNLGMIDHNSMILTHKSLANLTDEEILANYKNIKVIARALPSDKSRVASVLESNGLVVGMTGDGVNDAPALKKANVGFAMGSGSEIAKEASDIVILDDNIKSIYKAILYGRTIFKSIRKFIVFQLTMNFCALTLSIVGPLFGITSPITVMQMLWINMIMDTLAGLAYSFESPLKRYMSEKIIKKDEPILNKEMYQAIICAGLYSSLLLILFLKLDIFTNFIRSESNYYMTSFFSLFIFLSIFNAFNARTTRANIFSGLFKNKVFLIIMFFIFICQLYLIYFGGSLFRTYGLTLKELLFTLVLASTVIPVDIFRKIISRH